MDRKIILGAALLVALAFVAIVYYYNRTLDDLAAGSCTDAPELCPHEKIVETQNIVIGALLLAILVLSGVVVYTRHWKGKEENAHAREGRAHDEQSAEGAQKKPVDEAGLGEEEKSVLSIIREGEGSVFQSELMKKTGYSKVKVSRLLDRLEQKGIVERKRRGMANLVVLK